MGDPIGNFTWAYVGVTGRISTVTYPNAQTTAHAYLPNSGEKQLQEIHHRVSAGGTTLSKFTYGYDAVGNITAWTQQYGAAAPNAYDFSYDRAGQLTAALYRTTDATPVHAQALRRRNDLAMPLKYASGEEIRKGDRVLFHGEPGEIEFVVDDHGTDPALDWYLKEQGPGVMVREPKYFGSAYVGPNYWALAFVGRSIVPDH